MLPREARWIGDALRALPPERLYPLVNLGSSTGEFRTRHQPWIHAALFADARGPVVHVDLKDADGVDVAGDLADERVLAAVRARAPRSALCCNLLEHVPAGEREAYCARVAGLVAPDGFLVVSVPRAFPYHPDPVDTGLRPSVDEVAAMFAGFRVRAGEEVEAGRLWGMLRGNLRRLVTKSAGVATGQVRDAGRLRDWLVPWAWRPFRVTCVVLERA
ncbi:MAG: methyltransferase type 11 [Myxococcota bacterium]